MLWFRVIGPLVILQSFTYSLKFPMRNYPTWAQSLNGKLIVGISFNVDDEVVYWCIFFVTYYFYRLIFVTKLLNWAVFIRNQLMIRLL